MAPPPDTECIVKAAFALSKTQNMNRMIENIWKRVWENAFSAGKNVEGHAGCSRASKTNISSTFRLRLLLMSLVGCRFGDALHGAKEAKSTRGSRKGERLPTEGAPRTRES
ncbi:hypothetical protein cyc_07333 [Cyclospora cayetanensis]|uniref:Uncharacterized protein n=1 Tax=Cyclospora cayetanensis TaxID=88456 RepID=A0A1D3D623_9EIME|nr:hypothetical protein cyc_07333 [Cyclospora cayetanensis]